MSEKKDIAKLDFNVNEALNSLDKVDKKLKTISETSEAYAKRIGNNLASSINSGMIVDTKAIESGLDKTAKLSKTKADQLSVQLTKNKAKEQSDINKIVAKGEQDRQTAAYKSALKQEEYNNRVLKSTKTLYDKVAEYAKTYIIYQGFSELRQEISETIDEMVNMEYQMVAIERVLNDSSLDIDLYRDKLIQMAYDYGNSFENVADITLRLAQAGFDAQESLMLTEKTLLALNTAELNATQATDDMVAIMAQWGLMTGTATEQAEVYGNIIDKINKVADNFPTKSEDILNALKKTSSAFNLAGASIDETIATIVAAETASQRGGKVIGTALSNITQQLKAEGKLNLAEEMGLNFFTDAKKTQFRPIMEIFQEMSERMQSLKNEGKESSVEMQNLLSMFTVFRRNIGASLLGEMAGEDSTYAKALETSLNSVGYSLQENTKHMQTAKAAQAQFNTELLRLKTEIWDGGLENVFRDMLNLGSGLAEGIGGLIDKFGLLPVSVAAVTLAFSLLNKTTQASNWIGLKEKIQEINIQLNQTQISTKNLNNSLKETSVGFQNYIKSLDKGKASLTGYLGYQIKTTAQTILLTAKTILLQAAISGGITLAITALVGAIDGWIKAEEKAIETHTKLMKSSEENASKLNSEIENIRTLRKEYEELAKKEVRTDKENQKIYEIQEKLNQLIEKTGQRIELVTTKVNEQGKEVQVINDKYDEQLSKIKAIEYEKKRQETEELRNAAEEAQKLLKGVNGSSFAGNLWEKIVGSSDVDKVVHQLREIGIEASELNKDLLSGKKFLGKDITYSVTDLDFEGQYKFFKNAQIEFKKAEKNGEDVSEALNIVNSVLNEFETQSNNAEQAISKYNDALSELYSILGFADTLSSSLEAIADTYDIEGPKNLIKDIQDINTEFSNGTINIEEYFNKIQEKLGQINLQAEGEELQAYQAIFAETTKSLAEGLEGLISGLESGSINFVDYASGVKEAADNMLALRAEQNELELKDGMWQDAKGNVDEYANSLQNAISGLEGMGDLLTTIGDNYDYIAEHANEAGQAIFEANDVGTQSYINLANSVASSLNKMKNDNAEAYQAITNDIFTAMGVSANEVANADAYITEALNGNAQALNAALNASAAQVASSTQKVTTSMGKVLTELGNAISEFEYNITATPFISGKIGLRKDEKGVPNGLDLPSFGFDVTGQGGTSIKNLGAALNQFGADLTEYGSNKFTYTQLKSTQKPYVPTTSSPTTTSPSTTKSKGGGSSSNDRSEYYAQKEAEEAYKNRLKAFEEYIDNKEEDEENWTKRLKELNQLSNEDFLYITQERIKRYKKYLEEVEKATWMAEEDKLKLQREYSEEIKDLQIDYFGYLQDQLDDEISALEEANEEKIKLIEEEADARIAALQKVEDENDRIRAKEEYEKERQEHLNDISYWEQRTGREAQEALAEARKNLQELDDEWKKQQEDWTIEDQIAKIEEERDAEIKAIEDAQQKEIESIQAIYDAKVKLFAETGQIIYEGSVIQSQNLYNAYKQNFIDPISSDLANLNKAATTTATQVAAPTQQYETYTIKYGDTMSKIASNFGTTVEKIMQANPYVTNKNRIYAGKTLQIPKFHEGGIVGGNREAFALLKPNEVILKTEWAASLNRMMKYFDNLTTNNSSSISTGPTIEVNGDLIKIEANVRNQNDINNIEKKVEKMLKDKFNIKK